MLRILIRETKLAVFDKLSEAYRDVRPKLSPSGSFIDADRKNVRLCFCGKIGNAVFHIGGEQVLGGVKGNGEILARYGEWFSF